MNAKRPRAQVKLLTYAAWQALQPLVRDIRKRIVRTLQHYWWHTLLYNVQQYGIDESLSRALLCRSVRASWCHCVHTEIQRVVCMAPEVDVWRCTYLQRNKHTKKWERYLSWIENLHLLVDADKRVFPCEAPRASDGWLYK